MEYNSLSGSIPLSLYNLRNLVHLNMAYVGPLLVRTEGRISQSGQNSISGSLSDDVSHMESLEVLIMSRNALLGTIPSVLGDLSNLKEINLECRRTFMLTRMNLSQGLIYIR